MKSKVTISIERLIPAASKLRYDIKQKQVAFEREFGFLPPRVYISPGMLANLHMADMILFSGQVPPVRDEPGCCGWIEGMQVHVKLNGLEAPFVSL